MIHAFNKDLVGLVSHDFLEKNLLCHPLGSDSREEGFCWPRFKDFLRNKKHEATFNNIEAKGDLYVIDIALGIAVLIPNVPQFCRDAWA